MQSPGSEPTLSDKHVATVSTVDVLQEKDASALARSGKKQVLKRRYDMWSLTGLTTGLMMTPQASIFFISLALVNGGPAGAIWGNLLSLIGMTLVFIPMSELSSMLPTAGGQYHWTAVLAPKGFKALFSYIVGWVTVISWVAGPTSGCYLTSAMIQSLISFCVPAYQPQPYQGALIMWVIILLVLLLNTVFGKVLPYYFHATLVIFVIGFLALLIPVVTLGPMGDPREVFTRFGDGGNWGSVGLAFMVGLQGNVGAFIGTDSAIHMSEEVKKSETSVPWTMMLSLSLNGFLSFGILIGYLLHGGPIEDILAIDLQFPFMQIIQTATGSRAATIALSSYLIFSAFGSTNAGVAAGSRMLWSFARDKALPFSSVWSKVDKKNALPIPAMLLIFTIIALLGLIQIGSSVVFQAFVSLVNEGYCLSYLAVLSLLLYHRIKGTIKPLRRGSRSSGSNETPSDNAESQELEWGPWHVPGLLGTTINALGCAFLVIICFFSFWPPASKVDASSMNFAIVVLGGVMLFSVLYYFVTARKTYHGPLVEVRS